MSYQLHPTISIILPTRNEADNVPAIISSITTTLKQSRNEEYELLFVDDSTDHTPAVIEEFVKSNPRIRLFHREAKDRTGLATAFVLGFKKARGLYTVCMDSDLQHPPHVIPKLITELEDTKSDIAVASRYIKGGSAEGLAGFTRKAISILTKYFTQIFLSPARKTSDPGSGFFAFRHEVIEDARLSPLGFKILLEMLVRTSAKKVVDVPYTFLARANDTSKATFKQGVQLITHVFTLFWTVPAAGRFIRFGIVGIIGTIINLSLLTMGHELAGLSVTSAWFVAIGTSIFANFLLHNAFTFPENKIATWREWFTKLTSYSVLSLLTLSINFVAFQTGLAIGLYYVAAALIGIVISFGLNFILSRQVVWTNQPAALSFSSGYITVTTLRIGLMVFSGFLALYYIFSIMTVAGFITTVSLLLTLQGLFSLFLMIYAWESPENETEFASPDTFLPPQVSFTALVPARHEEDVITHTIATINAIDYPDALKQIIVICRSDDAGTIAVVSKMIEELGNSRISLKIFDGFPINKPHGLNIARTAVTNDVVTIFDAEDEPSADIYNVINTLYQQTDADIIQSGVQLMNHHSNWYSLFNVLEYFFWFKSSLHFFSKVGLTPLGGNTVFFKREWLEAVNGWDQDCLTEDADIGIRLSLAGAKIRVVYDPRHVTKEETPPTLQSFIKQRTRWNQGFIQILFKKQWMELPTFKQRLLALYILAWPFVQSFLIIYTPVALLLALEVKMPVALAIVANFPLYIFGLFLVVYNVGIWEFTRAYKKPYKWYYPIVSLIYFIPFQIVLGVSAFRACYRTIFGDTTWEKTAHTNAHRVASLTV